MESRASAVLRRSWPLGGCVGWPPAHDRAPRASDGDLEDETKARDLFEVLGAKGKQEELKPRLKRR